MSPTPPTKKVSCPTCRKTVNFSPENPFRPFCSERCHLLDLGAWADENYKIADKETTDPTVNENPDPKKDFHSFFPLTANLILDSI